MVGDRLHVLSNGRLLVWDRSDDAWTRRADRRARRSSVALVADGPRLVLTSGAATSTASEPDRVLDTRSGEWSVLPEDPLSPSFDRSADCHPARAGAHREPDRAGRRPEDPALVAGGACCEPGAGRWRRLPGSEQLGGWRWTWSGRHLVDPTLGGPTAARSTTTAACCRSAAGSTRPTGQWSTPAGRAPRRGPAAGRSRRVHGPVTAAEGWLYDDGDERWTRLPQPEGAPDQPGPATWLDDTLVVYGGEEWESATGSEARPDAADAEPGRRLFDRRPVACQPA